MAMNKRLNKQKWLAHCFEKATEYANTEIFKQYGDSKRPEVLETFKEIRNKEYKRLIERG